MGAVYALAISPNSRWLVTGGDDNTARLWDLRSKNPAADPMVLRGHDGAIMRVAFSADSRLIASASQDWTVRVWDVSNLPNASEAAASGSAASLDSKGR